MESSGAPPEAGATADEWQGLPNANVAVLFTDIVGSTAYIDRFGNTAGVKRRVSHDKSVRRIAAVHGGRFIKSTGDGVLAEFPDAAKAVFAAIDLQLEQVQHNQRLKKPHQFELRIGVAQGQVKRIGDDLCAHAVNLAARVTGHAGPAQILVTMDVKSNVAEALCRRVDSVHFKGISEPQEVFEIRWADEKTYHTMVADATMAVQKRELEVRTEFLERFFEPEGLPERYSVLERLGVGGMATVYKAWDSVLGTVVALKVLKPELASQSKYLERLKAEVGLARQVTHKNVCRIHDLTEYKGSACISMEFVDGQSLAQTLKAVGPFPVAQGITLAHQICDGLSECHRQGVVHRDLKPSNVMRDREGAVKVMDFGIARPAGSTASEGIIGTPSYSSPEQAKEQPVDRRTDIYATGLILYEILTGSRCFEGEDRWQVMNRQIQERPRPPRELRSNIPSYLEQVILKCLEKDPSMRFQSMEQLAVALRPQGGLARLPRVRWAAGIVLVVLLTVVAGWLAFRWNRGSCSQRQRVLVGHFEGAAAVVEFRAKARELFRNTLSESERLYVLPDPEIDQALARKRLQPSVTLSEALALDLATREGVPYVLTGNIIETGSKHQLAVRLLRKDRPEPLFVRHVDFETIDALEAMVKALASRIDAVLRQSANCLNETANKDLLVTTESTDAWKLYRQGIVVEDTDRQTALGLFRGAALLDPQFAMAHVQVANILAHQLRRDEAEPWFQAALSQRESVTARERYLIEGYWHEAREEYDLAFEVFERLISLDRDRNDPRAFFELAFAHDNVAHFDDAISYFREGLKLRPTAVRPSVALVRRLARRNRYDEALQEAEAARQRGIPVDGLRHGRGDAYLGKEDFRAAEAEFTEMRQSHNERRRSLGELLLSKIPILQGRWKDAMDLLERSASADHGSQFTDNEILKRYWLARMSLLLEPENGNRLARAQAERIAEIGDLQAEDLRLLGMLWLKLGNQRAAEATLRRLEEAVRTTPSSVNRSCAFSLRGHVALQQGELGVAADAFPRAERAYPRTNVYEGMAGMAAAREQWEDAAGVWEKVTTARGEIIQQDFPGDWILAHLEQARAFQKMGSVHRYEQRLGFVKSKWRKADPEVVDKVLAKYLRDR
jgi:class 3 adenylate cyclase/tetratricopeptide (TPR) repeat protein